MKHYSSLPVDYPLEERTIGRLLADKARRIPQHTFLLWQGQKFSYAQLESITNRYANGFSKLGIRHGDHVAVMLPNGPEFLWVVWGLAKLGAVGVPLNTAAKGEMLSYFVNQSDSVYMVVDQQWLDRFAPFANALPKVKQFLVAQCGEKNIGHSANISKFAVIRDLEKIVSNDDTAPPLDRVKPSDPHLIVYTSGTTGPSKGVMCPHSQALFVGLQIASDYGYKTDDVLYTACRFFT
jgi:carnitine-CoA ligase